MTFELKEISQSLVSTFQLINENETVEITSGEERLDLKNYWTLLIENFKNILKKLVDVIKEAYSTFEEILPEIFDCFIEGILKYTRFYQKELRFTFKQFFYLFELIGLREIRARTFNRISAALQWKVCPSSWIDLEFLNNYRNNLLYNTSENIKDSITNLIDMIKMIQREEYFNNQFESYLARILSE
jgi:hypothetical protein